MLGDVIVGVVACVVSFLIGSPPAYNLVFVFPSPKSFPVRSF